MAQKKVTRHAPHSLCGQWRVVFAYTGQLRSARATGWSMVVASWFMAGVVMPEAGAVMPPLPEGVTDGCAWTWGSDDGEGAPVVDWA
jgi:hypothetical protein